MKEEQINFCRPDKLHYCIDCCQGIKCCNLGTLPDNTEGCLGHHTLDKPLGFNQRGSCKNLKICISDEKMKDREKIIKLISQLPPGKYNLQDILNKVQKLR